MKHLCLFALLLLPLAMPAQTRISENMRKLGNWQDADSTMGYSEVWGYTANGREYAIVGGTTATFFIDVTNPQQPRLLQKVPARNPSIRDLKTYSHYAYEVMAGGGIGTQTLRVYDLQYLPDSVHIVYDSPVASVRAHTLYIDSQKLYLADNFRNSASNELEVFKLDVFSLANPAAPAFLGSFDPPAISDKMHAVLVKNDTAYCSFGYGGLFIYNLANLAAPKLIGSITSYPGQGYNHSAALTSDSRKLVFTDELPNGLPVKLYDLSDPADPVFLAAFSANSPATPHNVFIVKDRYVYLSYYLDGVQVFDMADPGNIKRTGYYDTFPENGNSYPADALAHMNGCYGVYPFLPSGNILAADRTHGLFVLKMEPGYSETIPPAKPEPAITGNLILFPNPASHSFSVVLKEPAGTIRLSVFDAVGKKVKGYSFSGVKEASVAIPDLAAGVYMVQVATDGFTETHRFLVKK